MVIFWAFVGIRRIYKLKKSYSITLLLFKTTDINNNSPTNRISTYITCHKIYFHYTCPLLRRWMSRLPREFN